MFSLQARRFTARFQQIVGLGCDLAGVGVLPIVTAECKGRFQDNSLGGARHFGETLLVLGFQKCQQLLPELGCVRGAASEWRRDGR